MDFIKKNKKVLGVVAGAATLTGLLYFLLKEEEVKAPSTSTDNKT